MKVGEQTQATMDPECRRKHGLTSVWGSKVRCTRGANDNVAEITATSFMIVVGLMDVCGLRLAL